MAEFSLNGFTNSERIYINTMSSYAVSNLMLVFNPEAAPIVPVIWQVAGRERRVELCSTVNDVDDIVGAVRAGYYDGILCWNLDKFSMDEHIFLSEKLMDPHINRRSHVVFTMPDFDCIHPALDQYVARMYAVFPTVRGSEFKLYEDDEKARVDRPENIGLGQRV